MASMDEPAGRPVAVPATPVVVAKPTYITGHEFDEYEADAVWQDIKLGARHPARSSGSPSSPTPAGPVPR